MSERHACRLLGQWRGTQRYEPLQRIDEEALTRAIVALASEYGRYGYAWEHSEFAKPASGQSPRHVSKPCLGRISVQSVRSSAAFSSRNDEAPSEASRSQDCANARKCQRKKEGALPGRFSRRWLVNSDAKTTDLLLKSPPFLL